MILAVVLNVAICLALVGLSAFVIALKVAAIKTPPPKPGEPLREANKRLHRAALAELRAWLANPWLWTAAAILTALLIAAALVEISR